MKKFIGNIIIKFIFKADKNLKNRLFEQLRQDLSNEVYSSFRKKYNIADGFRFNGLNVLFYGNGKIICGTNSYIGEFSTVQADQDCKVVIGNNCSISHNVRIYTTSSETDQDMNSTHVKNKVKGDVLIGNGVWIGANVFIKENIKIHNNVIVGANSVVTRDLEENGVYGGVPAKLIRFKNQCKT